MYGNKLELFLSGLTSYNRKFEFFELMIGNGGGGGKHFFFDEENDGARAFFEEKNDGKKTFSSEKNNCIRYEFENGKKKKLPMTKM